MSKKEVETKEKWFLWAEHFEVMKNLTFYGPYILESVVHDGFAFRETGGFPYVKYGNNWHAKG